MSTPFTRVAVTGHTLSFEARIPPDKRLKKHPRERVGRIALGAEFVRQMFEAALPPPYGPVLLPTDNDVLPHGRRQLWSMAWSPPFDEEKKKPVEGLRINRAEDVEYLTHDRGRHEDYRGWSEIGVSTLSPPPAAPEPETAVYVYLDVACDYSSHFHQLAPPAAGLVILHLANSDDLEEKHKERLLDFLDHVTSPDKSLAPPSRCVLLLVGDRVLNALGFELTEDRSWEAFADACGRELTPGRHTAGDILERLRAAVGRFDHLIVRHNPFAVVHARRPNPANSFGPAWHWRLYYLIQSDHQGGGASGFLRGYNDVLGLEVLAQVVCDGVADDTVADGIDRGVLRCGLFDERGYYDPSARPPALDLTGGSLAFSQIPRGRRVGRLELGPPTPTSLRRDWSVLDVRLRAVSMTPVAGGTADPVDIARQQALQVGRMIVRHGLNAAQRLHHFPAVWFEKLAVLDRRAFEAVYEIGAAMRNYLSTFDRLDNPLCLGLFGPPGGGKSFAVKQMAKSLNSPHLHLPEFEVNVSQYERAEDLTWVFQQVRDVALRGQVPLVFFDEFDASHDGRAFGWLQSFLAPMQDGKFGRPPNQIVYRHGIFVFVGGVNHSFDDILGRQRNRGYVEAKGPDFGSRLVRHLNVLGITQDDGDSMDFTFVLRRAMLLREMLMRFQRGLFRRPLDADPSDKEAEVDDDVVSALLTVRAFRHGVRSLEAIIRTSRLHHDRPRFHWGALPPEPQLDMHVDVRELTDARIQSRR